MFKRLVCVLMVILLLPSAAFAAGQYIIPDSNTRRLTTDELWQWSYESLGFILNEIFARHGYNFEVGKKYYNYFNERPWYTPNSNPNNSKACYPQLSQVEWTNERLVKDVREAMRAQKTTNPHGKHYLDYIEDSFDVLSGFSLLNLKTGQKLPVYSAPSSTSYRGANGKAAISTNGAVYAAGLENGWLLVMYETNNGGVRVGYVDSRSLKDKNLRLPQLSFTPITTECLEAVDLTDDPAAQFTTIKRLPEGTVVTYLSEFFNRYAWAYVETQVDGKTVRGFVDARKLLLEDVYMENVDAAEMK